VNIFLLDHNPVVAAEMQCDRHVIKMTLETAQILSTITGGPYKPTHQNHPCTVWARETRTNFNWLVRHGLALSAEYTYRYGKRHKCQDIIEAIAANTPSDKFPVGCTDFVKCMPDEYKVPDVVLSYRNYYHSKARFARWTKRAVPFWWMAEEHKKWVTL